MNWEQLFIKMELNPSEILDKIHKKDVIIYPEYHNTFKAFELCPLDKLKVVIIGQDCYHGPNQAIGLCFGVNITEKVPPSLRNILKELKNDIGKYNTDIDLYHWATQGVLLLNSALTVEEKKPGTHMKEWKQFTDNVIKEVSLCKSGIVFCLWGNYAKNKAELIENKDEHLILTATHPSPLSANKGGWFGNNHFSIINDYLNETQGTKIEW